MRLFVLLRHDYAICVCINLSEKERKCLNIEKYWKSVLRSRGFFFNSTNKYFQLQPLQSSEDSARQQFSPFPTKLTRDPLSQLQQMLTHVTILLFELFVLNSDSEIFWYCELDIYKAWTLTFFSHTTFA